MRRFELAFRKVSLGRLLGAVKDSVRKLILILALYVVIFVLTWAIPNVYFRRGQTMFGLEIPKGYTDLTFLLLGPLLLPIVGILLTFELGIQCPLVLLAGLLAFFSSSILSQITRLHWSAVTKISEFISGGQYRLSVKFIAYIGTSLTLGTIAVVLLTSPVIPTPDLGFIGMTHAVLAPIVKSLLGDQFYSTMIEQNIWLVGFATFALAPMYVLAAKIGVVFFFSDASTNRVRRAINVVLFGFYASLLVIVGIAVNSLFPGRPNLQAFRELSVYIYAIWLGLVALTSSSVICCVLDDALFGPGRLLMRLRKSVRQHFCRYRARVSKRRTRNE